MPRPNFYRWTKEDEDFKNRIAEAEEMGREHINDKAETKIIQHIGDGNLPAIKYWLKYNSHRYGNKPRPNIIRSFNILSEKKKKEISNAVNNFWSLVLDSTKDKKKK